MLKGFVPRALLSVLIAIGVVLTTGGVARAQNADCGARTPSGETAVSSYAQLQADVSTTGGSFYLTTSLADSAGSGGLTVSPGSFTLDLNGCSLSITHPAAGAAAITAGNTGSTTLTVVDSSAGDDGTLTATGGSGSGSVGGGAGIGGPSGTTRTAVSSSFLKLVISGGTVSATGGAATGATNASAGAGVGAGGADASDQGGDGASTITVNNGGTLVATGGAATASGNTGIPGVGIGGVINAGSMTLSGGTIRATGGAGNGTGAAGIGAGSYGPLLTLNSGTLAVTGGQSPSGPAWGFGPNVSSLSNITSSPTTAELMVGGNANATISGSYLAEFNGASTGTLNVAPGATWQVAGLRGQSNSVFWGFQGPINVPASSSLQVSGALSYGGSGTLNNVNITGTGSLGLSGGTTTLTNLSGTGNLGVDGSATTTLTTSSFGGSLGTDSTSTINIPAGQSFSLNSASTNYGTINLAGTLTGTGSLDNEGAIIFSGSGSIPGYGWQPGGLIVTGYRYYVGFPVPSPGQSPAGQWLWAKNFPAGGETLPAEPPVPGYTIGGNWELNGTPLDAAGDIGGQPSGNVVLTGNYLYNTTLSQQPAFGSVTYGNAITDTATVNGGSYYGAPTGSVSFYVCGPLTGVSGCTSTANAVGAPLTLGSGSGNNASATSASYLPTATGTYCFYAVYSGDPRNEPSSAGTGAGCFTVTPASTGGSGSNDATATGTPSVSPTQPTAGTAALLSASVIDTTHSSTPVNAGEVAFLIDGTKTVCVAEVINGTATCETSSLPAGTDSVTARYNGAAGFNASAVSGTLSVTVLASNQASVSHLAAQSRQRLAVSLKLASAGKVKVAVVAAHHTLASTTKSVRGKAARLALTLHLKAPRSMLRGHSASTKEKVQVRITYSPTGGHTRTLTKTLTLKLSQL